MAGYIYRGTKRTPTPPVTQPMTEAAKDAIAGAVLAIVTSLELEVAAAERKAFAATRRYCCGACGALTAEPACDVCRARLETAS